MTHPPIVAVDPHSPVPPYEQVRDQIAAMIASGALSPGVKLPTIRQLANDLGLAMNTVARAYRHLETTGHVLTRARSGTTVAPDPPSLSAAEVRARARAAAREYLTTVRALGLSTEDAIATLRGMP